MAEILEFPKKEKGIEYVTKLWNTAFSKVESAQITEEEMKNFINNKEK